MAGFSTGEPKPTDYWVGRGIMLLNPLIDSGSDVNKYEGFWDVGEIPDFKLTVESEVQEVPSSRAGLVSIIKRTPIQTKMRVSFTMREISQDTRRLFFFANMVDVTQAQLTGSSYTTSFAAKGRQYIIRVTNDSGARIRKISNTPTVVLNGFTGTEGVDFELDREFGILVIKDGTTATVANNIVVSSINASPFTDPAATELNLLQKSSIRAQVIFCGTNASNNDDPMETFLTRVSLVPEGDFDQITDEPQQMTIRGEAEKDTAFSSLASYGWIRAFSAQGSI